VPPSQIDTNLARMGTSSDRRTFLKQGLYAAGGLALGMTRRPHGGTRAGRGAGRGRGRAGGRAPNLLVIVVDQLRTPVWMPAAAPPPAVMPNLAALQAGAVSFERHYTASNDCSPARGALLTGLYSHQTGCMITGNSRLDPGFPTWGTLLRELGYQTWWWGKWHLNPNPNATLEPYGFSGGTYPSPNGAPGQGTVVDPEIAAQFVEWLRVEGGSEPWCATVSFVNPHDIAWWYRFTEQIPAESSPPALVTALPGNFETPEALEAQRKPTLQRSLQDTAAHSFGAVPFVGPEAPTAWTGLMDTYLMLQGYVDAQIGAVLDALAAQPAVQANTVVLFTSDHGEYGGSHGMRGKGASAYEEAIHVPLYVSDRRGVATAATGVPRNQLTSSVDIVPLLLSLATGSNGWRAESSLRHLTARADLAAICADAGAPGRPWVLHATDEDVTEFASDLHDAEAPRHVVALRTAKGKLGLYSNWVQESIEAEPAGEEVECYDYSTADGQAELANVAGSSALEEELRATLEGDAIPNELHAPLPGYLQKPQRRGMGDYFDVDTNEDEKAAASHLHVTVPSEPMPD
jgi:arylsulfatase A-like enzyme